MRHVEANSSSDEDVDVESTVSKRKKKPKMITTQKRPKKDDKKAAKTIESPTATTPKRNAVPSSPSTSFRGGYKVPEEMMLKSDEEMASSVQKYVEKLSQGLGLVPNQQPAQATVQVQPQTSLQTPKSQSAKKRRQKKESESSSEEERWLDAIQSGKLEEVDEELKKVKPKDPKLMTARQRAMLERKGDRDPGEQLMSLPSGYKEVVMTAEAMERKAIKSQKRKEKADEKREKDKKKTMERLLKKQESRSLKAGPKRSNQRNVPQITYRITADGPRLDLPPGVPFPLPPQVASTPPIPKKCGIKGCHNLKRYSCSKTGISLCSLQCYKKNKAIPIK